MESQNIDILLRIERTLGKHGAVMDTIQDDLKEVKKDGKETKDEVRYTNGKVKGLRSDMVGVQGDIKTLYQKVGSVAPKKPAFSWTWEKMLLVFGSIATVIAYVIEKL